MMSGLAAALNGVAALINDTFFVKVDGYIYAFDATTWGWIHLLLGAAFVAVGVFIVMGQPWAYLVASSSLGSTVSSTSCGYRSRPSGLSSSSRSMC